MNENAPEDFPKIKAGLFSTKPLNIDEVDAELEEIKGKIEEFEKTTGENADPDAQKEAFSGVVFVVFKEPLKCK